MTNRQGNRADISRNAPLNKVFQPLVSGVHRLTDDINKQVKNIFYEKDRNQTEEGPPS